MTELPTRADLVRYLEGLTPARRNEIKRKLDRIKADRLERERAERRERWRDDPLALAYEGLPRHFRDDRTPSAFHDDIVELLRSLPERRTPLNAARAAPRGHAKSTYGAMLWPIACALYPEHYGVHYVVVIRATKQLATESVAKVRDILGGAKEPTSTAPKPRGAEPAIVDTFGDLRTKEWGKSAFVTSTGVRIEAAGAGGSIRGLNWGPHRPQLVIIDDLDKDARSPEHRAEMRDWLREAVGGLGDVKDPMHLLVLGTMLSLDAVIYWATHEAPGWDRQVYKSVISWPDEMDGLWERWRDIYNTPGKDGPELALDFYVEHQAAMDAGSEVLWDGEDIHANMVFRESRGPAAHDKEKQNDPTDPANALIPREQLVLFGRDGDEPAPHTLRKVIAVDPSLGETDKSDYSAIALVGLGHDGIMYVLDCSIERRLPDQIIEDAFDLAELHRPDAVLWEKVAFQKFLLFTARQRAQERGISTPMLGWPDKGLKQSSKASRMQASQPWYLRGRVRVHYRLARLIQQLTAIRADGSSKDKIDGPDAVDMARTWLDRRAGGVSLPSRQDQERAAKAPVNTGSRSVRSVRGVKRRW